MHHHIVLGFAITLAASTIAPRTSGRESDRVPSPAQAPPLVYDLAVASFDITQTNSTPMFRDLDVVCVVQNLGPSAAPPKVEVLISRLSDGEPKILKRSVIPIWLPRDAHFEVRTKTSAWHTSTVPYRCEVAVPTNIAATDADSSNDAKELMFPKP